MKRSALSVSLLSVALCLATEARGQVLPPLPAPEWVSQFETVTINPGGVLDMNNFALIVGPDPSGIQYNALVSYVSSGMNGRDAEGLTKWDGWGIISSWARNGNVAAGYDRYSIGVVRNGDFDIVGIEPSKTAPFWGASNILADSVFVWATYNGDANLDGVVDLTDYQYWLNGYNGGTGVTGWLAGDFNYNGVTDMEDLSILQTNGVPEPSTLALLGVGVIGLLAYGWRRRKRIA